MTSRARCSNSIFGENVPQERGARVAGQVPQVIHRSYGGVAARHDVPRQQERGVEVHELDAADARGKVGREAWPGPPGGGGAEGRYMQLALDRRQKGGGYQKPTARMMRRGEGVKTKRNIRKVCGTHPCPCGSPPFRPPSGRDWPARKGKGGGAWRSVKPDGGKGGRTANHFEPGSGQRHGCVVCREELRPIGGGATLSHLVIP